MQRNRTDRKPLIHCITNPIAMNFTANGVLAIGGRPIMAEHPREVSEITENASALLLNFGNISDSRMISIKIALEKANQKKIPVVLDVCGVGCSSLRRGFFKSLMDIGKVDVIKGNYSEIMSLHDSFYRTDGVDADENAKLQQVEQVAAYLARVYDTMILATGEVDVLAVNPPSKEKNPAGISGGKVEVYRFTGGTPQMAEITATGCLLGAVIATFLAYEHSAQSVEKAVTFFSTCGKKAETDKGSGTFMTNFLDELSKENKIIETNN